MFNIQLCTNKTARGAYENGKYITTYIPIPLKKLLNCETIRNGRNAIPFVATYGIL